MVSVSLADTPDSENPYYQSFSGGETDESHSGENEPLGDLTLPAEFEAPEGYNEFGAIVLEFPDGDGGGNATVQTGDLTVEGSSYETEITFEIHYDENEPPYVGSYTSYPDGYGAVVVMNDNSTLDLTTGNINSNGSGVDADLDDASSLVLTIDGTTTVANDGIDIDCYGSSSATVNAGAVNTGGIALDLDGNEGSNINVTTQSIEAGNAGAGISLEGGSSATLNVNGSIEAGGS